MKWAEDADDFPCLHYCRQRRTSYSPPWKRWRKAETLVLAGTKDMISKAHTKMIAETIPKAKLLFLEGDHFLPMKRTDAFNSAVDEFFKEERITHPLEYEEGAGKYIYKHHIQ